MIDELLKRLGDHAELLARLLRRHHLLLRNFDLGDHLFELVFGERLAALELLHGGAVRLVELGDRHRAAPRLLHHQHRVVALEHLVDVVEGADAAAEDDRDARHGVVLLEGVLELRAQLDLAAPGHLRVVDEEEVGVVRLKRRLLARVLLLLPVPEGELRLRELRRIAR